MSSTTKCNKLWITDGGHNHICRLQHTHLRSISHTCACGAQLPCDDKAKPQDTPKEADYVRVLRFLSSISCAKCNGHGCKLCADTGFRGGDVHLLVHVSQTRRV